MRNMVESLYRPDAYRMIYPVALADLGLGIRGLVSGDYSPLSNTVFIYGLLSLLAVAGYELHNFRQNRRKTS